MQLSGQLPLYSRGGPGRQVRVLTGGESSSRRLPERRAPAFEVTTWLAGLGPCAQHNLEVVDESERRGQLTVSYGCAGATECAGETLRVRVRRVGGVAAAAWELTAEIGGRVERVVLPGGTRFEWRPPRGTHL